MQVLGENVPSSDGVHFPTGSLAEFMGALYVFEGSTLGGAVIHKALKKNDKLSGVESFNFYNCYGERLGMMWGIFLEHLTQIEDKSEVDQAIEAAKTTFEKVHEITAADKANLASS